MLFDVPAANPAHPAKLLLTGKVWYTTGVVSQINSQSDALTSSGLDTRKDKFLMCSDSTSTPYFPANLEDYAPWVATHGLFAPYGKCQGGCGNDVARARQSRSDHGVKIGHPVRFCSHQCTANWRKRVGITSGQFEKGHATWSKGRKGLNSSPGTQFQKGLTPTNKLPVGSVTIRTTKRDGRKRTFVKVAEPNTWRPRYIVVWESNFGPIPRGYVVHHVDRDTLNDAIGNLQLMTRGEHILEHRAEFEADRVRALIGAKRRGRV